MPATTPDAGPPDASAATPVPAYRSAAALGLFLGLTVALLAADLLIKAWAFRHVAGTPVLIPDGYAGDPNALIPPHPPVGVAPYLLSLRLTFNTGAVFGLGKGAQPFFILVSLAATAIIAVVFARSPRDHRLLHVCLALILAGALGNLYDRVTFNAVRDMFWMLPGVKLPFGLSWPSGTDEVYPWIFNLADTALVLGVALMMWRLWRTDKPPPADRPAPG